MQMSFAAILAHIFAKPREWLCALLLFSCGACAAAPPLAIDVHAHSYAVTPHVDFLEDASSALTIADVVGLGREFHPVPVSGNDDINFGYSSSAYWLRLVVDTKSPVPGGLLLEVGFPSLDHVDFYSEAGSIWQEQRAGDLKPFAARPVAHRNFVFPMSLRQPGQHTFYLRVASAGTLTIPLRLWETDAFDLYSQNSYAALALYFGMLLALMLYNLLLYFSLGDRNYLTYVCVVIGMAVGQLSLTGLGNQFLWPDWPAWGNVALPSGFAATAFFAALFTRGFLNTAQMAPRHDRVIGMLAGLSAFTALSPAFMPYTWAAILTSLIGVAFPAAAVSAGVVCLRHGRPGARYFLLAWTLLLCGTALLGMRNLGWVPTNFFTLYAMLIGSSLEILLLSFALADRIHILRQEKERAQNDALTISQRAERELESRVMERTGELFETNTRLLASEELERNRNKVLEALAKGESLTDVLTILAQAVEQSSEDKLCSIMLVDAEGKHLMLAAAPSLPSGYKVAVNGITIGDGMGSCGTAAWRGETVIAEDLRTHPCWVSGKPPALQAGLLSCWSEPIFDSAGTVLGVFAVYRREPGMPSASDVDMIRRSSHMAAIAIERWRMEEALLSSEQEFRSLAESLPDCIMRYDLDCRCIYVNPSCERETGMPIGMMASIAASDGGWCGNISSEEYKILLRHVMETGKPADMVLSWGRLSDGTIAYHALRIVAELALDGEIKGCLVIGRNITALKETERNLEDSRTQLRGLIAQNEAVREEERKYIAREVHDELGQILTGLQMDISMVSHCFGPLFPALHEHLRDTTLEMVNKSLVVARDIASSLRPTALDLGIVSAIEWLGARFSNNTGIDCEVHVREEYRGLCLDEDASIALFRIAQESLTNITRHANASKVVIIIGQEGDEYLLEVRDNGIGFDPALVRRNAFGLVGIQERVLILAGKLSINSRPGSGTTIRVCIPAHDITDEQC